MPSYPLTQSIRINWGDMDALGHVNNTIFIRWFEVARMGLFEALTGPVSLTQGVGPILASVTCDYLRPVVYPGTVVVGTRVAKLGNTSFTLEHGLWLEGAPEALQARGQSVVVLVDYASGTKTPIPGPVRERLTALQG
jgi:acyl-CoA thioester hydrolase